MYSRDTFIFSRRSNFAWHIYWGAWASPVGVIHLDGDFPRAAMTAQAQLNCNRDSRFLRGLIPRLDDCEIRRRTVERVVPYRCYHNRLTDRLIDWLRLSEKLESLSLCISPALKLQYKFMYTAYVWKKQSLISIYAFIFHISQRVETAPATLP